MLDDGLANFEKWFRVALASLWAAVIVYYLAPQYHSFLGLCRALATSLIVSSTMFLWWLDGGPLTEYQQLITIVFVSSISDCVLVGLLKLLVMFRTDPVGIINKLKGLK